MTTTDGRESLSEGAEGAPPTIDLESRAWWDGLRSHRLFLQHCEACGRTRFPPMPRCPWCASDIFDLVESPGRGAVYSFVTAHVAISPGYRGSLPYTVATVTLDEGPRLLGRVEPSTGVAIGDRVAPQFLDHTTWTELLFTADPSRS